MKKILLVTRPIAPPWDEASKNFAFYLAKNTADFELNLLTNGIIADLPESVRQRPIYTSNDFSYFQKIRLIKHLRKIKNEFDILHYIFTPTKQNSFLLKHFVNYKKNGSIRTIQTIATLREDLYSDKDIRNLIFADLVITYSDYAKNKLNALGFNNVKRIYPGIDLDLYSPAEKYEEIQKILGAAKDEFIVDYPGEFVRLGATDDLVRMAIDYADEFRRRKIKLCFPGRIKGAEDLQKKAEIKKTLREKGAMDIVIFSDEINLETKKKEDFMKKRYNTSDIIIFPVRDMKGKFDVPLAVVEAMACGKPVVISDLPILKEFAQDGNSVTIERGNIEQLKNVILDLYDDLERRLAIGKNARKFAEENFDIKKVAEIYQKIYEVL